MIINIFGNVQSVGIEIAIHALTYMNLKRIIETPKNANNFIRRIKSMEKCSNCGKLLAGEDDD